MEERANMSVVKRFLEKAGGPWIRAESVKPGDTVSIRNVSLDEESFDRPYLVVDGVLDRTGEQVRVRLGGQNVNRIVQDLGTDEAGWVGHRLQVVSVEFYPGLGRKGILWKGVRTQGPAPIQEAELRAFLRTHVEEVGADIPGLASNVDPNVLAEAERRGFVELLEVRGKRMYMLTEAGKRYAGVA
jgi:hypothetical protein